MNERRPDGAIENRPEYYLDSRDSLDWRSDEALARGRALFFSSESRSTSRRYYTDANREIMELEKQCLLNSNGAELYAVLGLKIVSSRRNDDFSLRSTIEYSGGGNQLIGEHSISHHGNSTMAIVRHPLPDSIDDNERRWEQMIPYDFDDLFSRYDELEQAFADEREVA